MCFILILHIQLRFGQKGTILKSIDLFLVENKDCLKDDVPHLEIGAEYPSLLRSATNNYQQI